MGDTTAIFTKYIIKTTEGWRQFKYEYKLIVSQVRRVRCRRAASQSPLGRAARARSRARSTKRAAPRVHAPPCVSRRRRLCWCPRTPRHRRRRCARREWPAARRTNPSRDHDHDQTALGCSLALSRWYADKTSCHLTTIASTKLKFHYTKADTSVRWGLELVGRPLSGSSCHAVNAHCRACCTSCRLLQAPDEERMFVLSFANTQEQQNAIRLLTAVGASHTEKVRRLSRMALLKESAASCTSSG
jgi:hypothetical protein